jgi:hypothetical protein
MKSWEKRWDPSIHKGTTLKETVETRNYGYKLFFMVKFPEVLGSTTYIQDEIKSRLKSGNVCNHLVQYLVF